MSSSCKEEWVLPGEDNGTAVIREISCLLESLGFAVRHFDDATFEATHHAILDGEGEPMVLYMNYYHLSKDDLLLENLRKQFRRNPFNMPGACRRVEIKGPSSDEPVET